MAFLTFGTPVSCQAVNRFHSHLMQRQRLIYNGVQVHASNVSPQCFVDGYVIVLLMATWSTACLYSRKMHTFDLQYLHIKYMHLTWLGPDPRLVISRHY